MVTIAWSACWSVYFQNTCIIERVINSLEIMVGGRKCPPEHYFALKGPHYKDLTYLTETGIKLVSKDL